MREAGKKKMETQLPHLWNPHKIKKIRQDETEIQNINLGGTCTRRLSPLGRKRLALAGRDMCRKIPLSVAPHHRFGYRSIHSDLCPHHRGNTLVTHFLNRQIYEKKKQDNRTAMQILRSGQHLRVYGIGLPQRKHIRLWELYKELNRKHRKEFILYLFSEVEPIHIQEIILAII